MKKLCTLTILVFVSISLCLGQSEETVFNKFGGIKLTGLWGGSTNAIVDFEDDFNINNGGFFVFEINNNFLIGWTGYDSDVTSDGQEIRINGNDLLLGYAFNSKRVIHPVFYIQLGSGILDVSDIGSDRVFVAQPMVGAEINIARFFRLGIEGGYRYFNGVDLAGFGDKDFSSPVFGLKLKFGWSWGR